MAPNLHLCFVNRFGTETTIFNQQHLKGTSMLERLTNAERKVASFVIQGFPNSEISKQLNIKTATVKLHCTSIYKKCGVKNRASFISKHSELKLADLAKTHQLQKQNSDLVISTVFRSVSDIKKALHSETVDERGRKIVNRVLRALDIA
jgi:DNA-binding CsgD family transcriptional regulator